MSPPTLKYWRKLVTEFLFAIKLVTGLVFGVITYYALKILLRFDV
jgi:hypothetical protein